LQHECRAKVPGIDAVQALLDGDSRRGEIERSRYGSSGSDDPRCAMLFSAEPIQERAASERNAHGKQRCARRESPDRLEHPRDLGVITRMIGARATIRLAAAAAEMR